MFRVKSSGFIDVGGLWLRQVGLAGLVEFRDKRKTLNPSNPHTLNSLNRGVEMAMPAPKRLIPESHGNQRSYCQRQCVPSLVYGLVSRVKP